MAHEVPNHVENVLLHLGGVEGWQETLTCGRLPAPLGEVPHANALASVLVERHLAGVFTSPGIVGIRRDLKLHFSLGVRAQVIANFLIDHAVVELVFTDPEGRGFVVLGFLGNLDKLS